MSSEAYDTPQTDAHSELAKEFGYFAEGYVGSHVRLYLPDDDTIAFDLQNNRYYADNVFDDPDDHLLKTSRLERNLDSSEKLISASIEFDATNSEPASFTKSDDSLAKMIRVSLGNAFTDVSSTTLNEPTVHNAGDIVKLSYEILSTIKVEVNVRTSGLGRRIGECTITTNLGECDDEEAVVYSFRQLAIVWALCHEKIMNMRNSSRRGPQPNIGLVAGNSTLQAPLQSELLLLETLEELRALYIDKYDQERIPHLHRINRPSLQSYETAMFAEADAHDYTAVLRKELGVMAVAKIRAGDKEIATTDIIDAIDRARKSI